MNDGLDKIYVIDRAQLDEESYFQSLLELAHGKGLLSDNDIKRMQYECLSLLADQTERYNTGDSSSILIEKAQAIMTSILFTIGVWLKTYPNPDNAVSALQQGPINEIYQKGRKRIDALVARTKVIHTKLLHHLVDTQNYFYRDTLVGGILGFFKLYYPDFSAQEIHITADYPLFNPLPQLAGVEFIKAYVEAAYCENLFCSYFSAEDIHHQLSGYAEDYQGLLINIYEFILTAALGCIVAGVDCSRLDVTEAGVQFLCQAFVARPQSEILAAIAKAADELNRRFQFSRVLTRYVQSSLPLIAGSIEAAAKEHTLNRIFFTPAYPENNPKISFSCGEKMDDEQYRKVVEEIRQCRFSQDKIAIINERIHSLSDLEDVLLDADLTDEEMQDSLRALGLPEIAALSQKHQLQHNAELFELREQELRLYKCLQCFISTLPPIEREWIAQTSEAMQEE